MEEEMLSLISTAKTDVISDESDANSSSFTYHAGDKRSRPYETTNGSPGTGGGPKFKGVVPQQNGHWGAQIYANHQRIWLGTFKSEKEAAMAYDSAAIKLRSGDSHRNFPWTKFSIQEPNFQDLYTAEAVLNMIKDGSYPSKFEDFLRTQTLREETRVGFNMVRMHGKERFLCTQLFQKELTPSDVGKLNRLVIPKKYAVKYFPHITDSEKENVNAGGVDDVLLIFYDKLMRSWKFRYCYWRSSQSFVFTRGWNRFVKEKDLKSKDIVSFYICEPNDKVKEGPSFFLIDVIYNQDGNNSRVIQGVNQFAEMNGILEQDFSQTINHGSDKDENEFEDDKDLEDDKVLNELETTPIEKKKCLRLFGVQIN